MLFMLPRCWSQEMKSMNPIAVIASQWGNYLT